MEQLFTRTGTEFKGTVDFNDAGKPIRFVDITCDRCTVFQGQRVWCRGTENGRPFSFTGFDCWTCGNTGVRGTRKERLFTAAELARANKAADTRAAKKAESERIAREAAEAARASIEANYRAVNADFLAKLATLCTGDGSQFWDRFAADLLVAFKNPSERQVALVEGEVLKRRQNATSAHIGAVGDKITVTVTVERVFSLPSVFYGQATTWVQICRDEQGNVVTYKGSVYFGNKGDTATVKATIKAHEFYNGVAQTVIQRPKLID